LAAESPCMAISLAAGGDAPVGLPRGALPLRPVHKWGIFRFRIGPWPGCIGDLVRPARPHPAAGWLLRPGSQGIYREVEWRGVVDSRWDAVRRCRAALQTPRFQGKEDPTRSGREIRGGGGCVGVGSRA